MNFEETEEALVDDEEQTLVNEEHGFQVHAIEGELVMSSKVFRSRW